MTKSFNQEPGDILSLACAGLMSRNRFKIELLFRHTLPTVAEEKFRNINILLKNFKLTSDGLIVGWA